MPTIAPVSEQKANEQLKPTYDALKQKLGKVPNFFGMLAHKPDILNTFLPFYAAVTGPGAVDQRYKELAYLKTSLLNGCEY
jgi:alkylhydroperoxidase family enzyme